MCHALPDPKFMMRDVEARLRAARPISLQNRDKSPQIPGLRLAALRVWWQSMKMRMLRKGVPYV